jgi:hypothetical protein
MRIVFGLIYAAFLLLLLKRRNVVSVLFRTPASPDRTQRIFRAPIPQQLTSALQLHIRDTIVSMPGEMPRAMRALSHAP